MIHRRDSPPSCGFAVMTLPTLVARIQRARFALIAGPTIDSDAPFEYTSAVSMKFTPASNADATMFRDTDASVRSPNIIVPRQSTDTSRPESPRRRKSMGVQSSVRGAVMLRQSGGSRNDERVWARPSGIMAPRLPRVAAFVRTPLPLERLMHVFFEDDGVFKAGTVLADNDTSLQV